jgi:hypothetical protein
MSLPALDFLPLISGASFAELKNALSVKGEPGRMNCLDAIERDGLAGVSLFPVHDERYFLEVLYLKLSFLGDVLRQIFPQPGITGHPEMRLTIDRIWVKLPAQSGLLPSFWNFRTKILDIVRPSDITQMFPEPASSNLLHGGLLWFYGLLVNKRQNSRDLMPVLKETASSKDGPPAGDSTSNPVFSPEQIYWDPEGKQVNSQWLPLWEQSLALGFTLLQSAIHTDRQWSFINFFTEFENLRTEVRVAMLGDAPIAMELPAHLEQPAGDEVIHNILKGIIGKWRGTGTAQTLPGSLGEERCMMETVILSPPEIAARVSAIRDEEEWTETVVLSARDVITEPPQFSPRDLGSDAVLETVVLSAGGAKREPSTAVPLDESEDAMPETVILSPGVQPEGKEEAADGDSLLETVILNSQKAKVKAKGWKD